MCGGRSRDSGRWRLTPPGSGKPPPAVAHRFPYRVVISISQYSERVPFFMLKVPTTRDHSPNLPMLNLVSPPKSQSQQQRSLSRNTDDSSIPCTGWSRLWSLRQRGSRPEAGPGITISSGMSTPEGRETMKVGT